MESKDVLQNLIQKSGISQKEISDLINIDEATISKMKKGKRSTSIDKFLTWCEVLNVKPKDCFDNSKNINK